MRNKKDKGEEEIHTADIPVAVDENVKAVEEDNDDEEAERAPGQVRLEGALHHQRVAVDALRLQRLVEAQVAHADRAPREQTGNRRQVLEPVERRCRTTRARRQVRQKTDGGRGRHSVVGHTTLGAGQKDGGRLAVLGQGVQVAGAGIQEGIGRR